MPEIRGRLLVPPDAPSGPAARVVVELRDVSLADAPSTVVAEQSWGPQDVAPGDGVPFSLQAPTLDPRRAYSLRAHVDRRGDGAVRPGDLLSTASHPVDVASVGPVTVPLTVVTSPGTPGPRER